MKTRNYINLSLLLVGVAFFTSCDTEEIIPESKLPAAIQTYITTHFPSLKVVQVKEEKEFLQKSLEVTIEGGVQLDFNHKEEITDIDSNTELPDSVIPTEILAYVASNYPSNVITDWEIDDKNQQIGLDNGIDLDFTMAGEFLRIDD